MNFLSQIFSKNSKNGFKIAKVNEDWVVMRDYSIVYVGSKKMCQSYITGLIVAG